MTISNNLRYKGKKYQYDLINCTSIKKKTLFDVIKYYFLIFVKRILM